MNSLNDTEDIGRPSWGGVGRERGIEIEHVHT